MKQEKKTIHVYAKPRCYKLMIISKMELFSVFDPVPSERSTFTNENTNQCQQEDDWQRK